MPAPHDSRLATNEPASEKVSRYGWKALAGSTVGYAMDGFDLLRNIRSSERLKDLPVIMITSRMATKHRDLAMALGANHYLGKPYGDEQLLGIIHSYTDA